jgi:hypothetical protein
VGIANVKHQPTNYVSVTNLKLLGRLSITLDGSTDRKQRYKGESGTLRRREKRSYTRRRRRQNQHKDLENAALRTKWPLQSFPILNQESV